MLKAPSRLLLPVKTLEQLNCSSIWMIMLIWISRGSLQSEKWSSKYVVIDGASGRLLVGFSCLTHTLLHTAH
jgi:hypothetical protein